MQTRSDILNAVLASRQATNDLAAHLKAGQLDASTISVLLERGALIEDAHYEVLETKRDGIQSSRSIEAISAVFKDDRDDILDLFEGVICLDPAIKQNWLEGAIAAGAIRCLKYMVKSGRLEHHEKPEDLVLQALRKNDSQSLEILLGGGAPVHADVPTYQTHSKPLIHWAHDPDCLSVLLRHGGDLNARDSHGHPPLSFVLDRLKYADQEKEAALTATADALLKAGAQVFFEKTAQHPHGWRAIDDVCEFRKSHREFIHLIAQKDPIGARKARPQYALVAKDLLDTGVIEDLALFSRKIRWGLMDVYSQDNQDAIEYVLDHGVPPPSILLIESNFHQKWLEIGIPVSNQEIEKKVEKLEMEEDVVDYTEWNGLFDVEKVKSSNAIAQARALRTQTLPTRNAPNRSPRL